jgi:hypothetical protein
MLATPSYISPIFHIDNSTDERTLIRNLSPYKRLHKTPGVVSQSRVSASAFVLPPLTDYAGLLPPCLLLHLHLFFICPLYIDPPTAFIQPTSASDTHGISSLPPQQPPPPTPSPCAPNSRMNTPSRSARPKLNASARNTPIAFP